MSKVLVVGLDGATLDLIKPWATSGELPGFARLLQNGAYGCLHTVPNTDTAPAWTTFATGLNPANHGLFHELGWTADRRTLRPVQGADRDGVPFWQLASDAGRRVVVMNVPFTYPVDHINGVMLAGIDAPSEDAPGFSHPPDFLTALRRNIGNYQIDSQINLAIKEGRPEEGLEAAYTVAEQHTNALLYAMQREPWDLAIIVYSIPDEMQHFFWQQMVQKTGPQRDAILGGHRFIERQIDRLLAQAGSDTVLLLMSDHGFGPICATTEYLADWLARQGFLRYLVPARQSQRQRLIRAMYAWLRHRLGERQKLALRRWLPALRNRVESDARFIGIDWSSTRAYVGPSPWEIWINTQGREPHGSVAPGLTYEQVRETVIAALLDWRSSSGQPYIRAAYRREEVYRGRYLSLAPDITVEWNPDAAPIAATIPGNNSRFDADHQPEGILFVVGPGVHSGYEIAQAHLTDVAPTILHLLDVPLPERIDGRILDELFVEAVGIHQDS